MKEKRCKTYEGNLFDYDRVDKDRLEKSDLQLNAQAARANHFRLKKINRKIDRKRGEINI